jgi:hypothetical protein
VLLRLPILVVRRRGDVVLLFHSDGLSQVVVELVLELFVLLQLVEIDACSGKASVDV